ncbi:MAG: hypothetical protein KAS32_22595, partial [Candidatus Peribacteraceae bacterium]|nr:hypothetical protein [Candidatus Peribacteraceae bacterium]
DLKIIIDNPMRGFYNIDATGKPLTVTYSVSHIHKIKVPSINFDNILHPVFHKQLSETGILTQGIESIKNYVYWEMSRAFADEYQQRKTKCDNTIPPYSYSHRLMYYPRTMETIEDILHNIDEYQNDSAVINQLQSIIIKHQYIDQLTAICSKLPERQGSRRIKANLWIPEIDLFTFENSPCLQEIKFENLGENNVHITTLFRSWDAFNGLPANIPGILNLLYTEVLEPNNMMCSRLTCNGEDTHIYSANIEDAKKIPLMANEQNNIIY